MKGTHLHPAERKNVQLIQRLITAYIFTRYRIDRHPALLH